MEETAVAFLWLSYYTHLGTVIHNAASYSMQLGNEQAEYVITIDQPEPG